MRSNFWWSSESCNSQCLSHFAAAFITTKHALKKNERAICVQLSSGSLNLKIHNADHSSVSFSSLFEKPEPPNTPTPDPTAQHPTNPTPNPSCGKPHPKEGKEGSTTEKKREKRNSTQRRRPSNTTQQKTRKTADPPRTPPKGGGQATPRYRRQGRRQFHPVHHPKEEQAKQHHRAGTSISRGHRNRCEGTAIRAA